MSEMARRVVMTIVGVTVTGLSVGLFSYADLGLDPFMVFAHGTWNLTPLSFGTYYMVLSAVMFAIIIFIDRKKFGLGTLINLFLSGYMADFSEWVLNQIAPVKPGLAGRLLLLLLAVVIMCFSSALYYIGDLGVSTYDAVAMIIDERNPKWKFRYIRIATDFVCVIIGGLLGARVGLGTVITAFFMGPLISFFEKKVAEPFRYGKASKLARPVQGVSKAA